MSGNLDYDVALSFAGEDREKASALSRTLKIRNLRVFYDEDYQADLIGKDLYSHLSELYLKRATFMVMLVSRHYAAKLWTNHERRAAQARALHDNSEYILPIRLDDTDIPGLLDTTHYIRWPPHTADTIADLIVDKVNMKRGHPRNFARSGIEVYCRRLWVPKFFHKVNPTPRCVIDDCDRIALKWHKFVFIPLIPEKHHHLQFYIRLAAIGPPVSIAELDCFVRGAEVLRFTYEAPVNPLGRGIARPFR